jgi:hypothetical protein
MTPTVMKEAIQGAAIDQSVETACDEQRWDAQFAGSLDVLEDLYDEITADEKAGHTTPINA